MLLLVKSVLLLLVRPFVWLFGVGTERVAKWHRSMYFGEIIVIVLEGSMEFLICGYFNLVNQKITSNEIGEQLSLYVAYSVLFLTLIIMPTVYFWLWTQT